MTEANSKQRLTWGREVLEIEGNSLLTAADRLDEAFSQAVEAILSCKGRVIVTGLGKSGHVSRKISSTLSSTGTPSYFLHPAEAMHGDLGVITSNDILLAVAYGGETNEVIEVAKYAKRQGLPVIGITGQLSSSLAAISNIILNGAAEKEACPLNLAPTVSSTVALALGDALAIAVMHCRGITDQDFARFHPGGSLGRRLVSATEVMKPLDTIGLIAQDTSFSEVIETMNRHSHGIVGVVDENDDLIGAVTDGDIRRVLLQKERSAHDLTANQFMTKNPKTMHQGAMAVDAVRIMEEHKITSIFLISKENKKVLGLLRLHDLIEAKIL